MAVSSSMTATRNLNFFLTALVFFCLNQQQHLFSQASLPLMQISDMQYEGAFRIPADQFGESDANYSPGIIGYNNSSGTLFLAGHQNAKTLGEFTIPTLVSSTDLSSLNEASIVQDFTQILDQTTNGNPQLIDRISGLTIINDKLYVNGVEWYDAPANNTHTTLVIENPSNIAGSIKTGYYSMEGAAHAAGWISPVPNEWQALIGEDYIAGSSSKYSINSRLPIGVTAFAFDPTDITGTPSGTIPTVTLLDFSLDNPLDADYSSYDFPAFNVLEMNGDNSFSGHTVQDADIVVGQNDIWTTESQASYGFIVPGTRTYLSIGSSGGHRSGMGYKAQQDTGYECPGPCPYEADDYDNYYWLWDVNDLIAVKNGSMNPHDVRPYDYGVFNAPFQTDVFTNTPEFHPILGGTYDSDNEILYLSIYDGASLGRYDRVPVIAAYSFADNGACPVSINQSGTTTVNESQHASHVLNSNAIISADVTYKAGNSINLTSGFSVKSSYVFTAHIEACQ